MVLEIALYNQTQSKVAHSGVPTHSDVCNKTPMSLTNSVNLTRFLNTIWPNKIIFYFGINQTLVVRITFTALLLGNFWARKLTPPKLNNN